MAYLVHEEPLADPDLRGGQPDAVGGVIGLEHVGDQGAELVVEDFDFRGPAVQHGLAPDRDGQDGHVSKVPQVLVEAAGQPAMVRPTTSRMISLVPPKIVSSRAAR